MDCNTTVNIGAQRFDKVIEEHRFYIDKTTFIKEWWENGSDVTLITRPRRFGKTLNMNMLECFFSNQYAERGDLFEGLSIWEEPYRQLQGTFPVISMSFAPIKTGAIAAMKAEIKQMIVNIYSSYKEIMKSAVFDSHDRAVFDAVDRKMDDATAYMAIHNLCIYLSRYYKKDVIILLDEYDTPMQESWLAGTWDETVDFFRQFFNYTFKTNPCLCRGIITGITRISKESIFSDLNNLDVITTTSDKYATSFGFTQEEVFAALDATGYGSEKENVKKWYDGFTFGSSKEIYNPWSITSFIANKGKYRTYWVNTSTNRLINSLIQSGTATVKQHMEELLQGKNLVAELDEQIIFDQLYSSTNAVWSLLLATGYLKVTQLSYIGGYQKMQYTLALTNMEVVIMFETMIKEWFGQDTEVYYNEFIKALLNGNVRKMNTFMNKVALYTFSSFDSGTKPSASAEPERFYHGFVLGMVVSLADTYQIRSNRESGYGRYDVMMKPRDRHGKAFIFEFKVIDPDEDERTLEDTLANAHLQIEEKQYEAELIAEGFLPGQIYKYGFAFRGKECLIG